MPNQKRRIESEGGVTSRSANHPARWLLAQLVSERFRSSVERAACRLDPCWAIREATGKEGNLVMSPNRRIPSCGCVANALRLNHSCRLKVDGYWPSIV
jgi:hypothetical protein